jgi:GTP-binding protein
VVNKVDNLDPDLARAEFSPLGMGEALAIAGAHGRGITQMLEAVLGSFPKDEGEPEEGEEAEEVAEGQEAKRIPGPSEKDGIKLAIIGRPNVGKSTLVNRMLGEDRVIVFDQAGTTRDSIYIPFERDGEKYTLIDTAGVRRRGKIFEAVEKFSVVKTLQAIQDSNVVVFVMDAREGVVDHDLNLLGFVLESGRALVIALNKWDGMEPSERDYVKTELQRRLFFVDFADIHFISALHGTGVGHLYKSVQASFQSAITRWPTSRLTQILEDAVREHQPPLVNGRRIKLRYAHLGGANPPLIVIHGNQVDAVPRAYSRYLENTYRRVLKLVGTPIRIEYKGGENPYEDKKNTLTDRQVNKKRRLMSHHKKAEKKRKDKKR